MENKTKGLALGLEIVRKRHASYRKESSNKFSLEDVLVLIADAQTQAIETVDSQLREKLLEASDVMTKEAILELIDFRVLDTAEIEANEKRK